MLVGFTIIRDNFKMDYLLEEAVSSALPVVDRHIIVECFSTDDTWDLVKTMAREEPKITLLRHPWGEHFTILQRVADFAISHVPAGDWFFQLQADEVIHEGSYPLLMALPRVCQDVGAVVARPHYWHFMGNYDTEFDFMYRRKTVFAQQGHGWRWDGDACQLFDGRGGAIDVDVEIFHYGKVHEAATALRKEQTFQAMYREAGLGFPDPSLKLFERELGGVDYFYLFRNAIKEGQVREFTGSHPSIMADRIAKAKSEGWEQFEAKLSLDREPNDYMGGERDVK